MSNNDTASLESDPIGEQHAEYQRDIVFNAETCRALRREIRDFGRLAAVIVSAFTSLSVILAVDASSLSPTVELVVMLVESCVAAGVVVTVMKWADHWPDQEVRHELGLFIQNLRTEGLDALKGGEPCPPVPELAAGRSGVDWSIIIGLPLAMAFRVIVSYNANPLLLGGCLAVGVVLFIMGPMNMPTYPVDDSSEGSIHDR